MRRAQPTAPGARAPAASREGDDASRPQGARRPADRAGRGADGHARGGSRAGRTAGRLPADVRALEAVVPLALPADAALRAFFRANPALGRRDRAAVAETVFDALRNRRLYAHLAAGGEGSLAQRLVAVSRLRRGMPVRLDAGAGGLPDWLRRVREADSTGLPFEVRFSLPDWLAAALLEPAPLDLRVNVLKGGRDAAIAMLAGDGIVAEALALAPLALRVQGKPALETSRAFREGLVEVQDAGSQLLALLVGARRGQTVVDLCAGAGGKTLALAASMRSTGQVFACDVSTRRLQRLRPRLQRAGATNVQPMAIDGEHDRRLDRLAGRADAVLVDAPCSGTGTLRRNPDLKWRVDPHMLGRLRAQQQSILRAAARLVRPGGVLVYATCSLLPEENEHQAEAFEAVYPQFVREPARACLRALGAVLPGDDADDEGAGLLRLSPEREGVDGFFAVRWRRDPGAAGIARASDPGSGDGASAAPQDA